MYKCVTKVLHTTLQVIGIGHVIEENKGLRYKSFNEGLLVREQPKLSQLIGYCIIEYLKLERESKF